MIVIDASAAVDLLLGTKRAAGVRGVLGSVTEAHAPELIDPEVVSVIRRWLLRRQLPVEAADRAVGELGQIAMVRHRHGPLRRRTWELRDRCSTYDACYVALAEVLGAELLTTDVRLGRTAQDLVDVVVLT